MDLSKKDVEKLAALARLELSEDEKQRFAEQLSSILDYVEQLDEVETKHVGLGTHVPPASVFRTDDEKAWPDTSSIIGQFPARAGNLNKVRPVLE